MATVTSQPATMTTGKKWAMGAATVALLALLWLIFNFSDIKNKAKLGAAYGAHIACSCRYVQGRPLNLCYKDFEPGMGMVSLSDDPAHKRVTASVPLLASAISERHGGYGCQILTDEERAALD